MVFFNLKVLETKIKNRAISTKEFIIYSFFIIGSFVSLVRNTRHPVNTEAHEIMTILSFIPIVIVFIKFIECYKIIKEKDINIFLYSIIPLTFVLRLRYFFIVFLPLLIINTVILLNLNIETSFWNMLNVRIINIIMNIILAVHFLKIMKYLYKNSENNNEVVEYCNEIS
jgi:hypothetical protein